METFLLLLYISGAARSHVKAAKRQHRHTGTALIALVLLAVFTQSSHSAPTSRTQHHHSNPCGAYNRHDMTALERANTLLQQVRHVINTLAEVRMLYVSTHYVIVAAKNRVRRVRMYIIRYSPFLVDRKHVFQCNFDAQLMTSTV